MYQVRRLGVISIVATAAALAGERGLRREGPYWVETVQGSESIRPRSSFHVSTIGGVTAKGTTGDQISYTLTKRVKAGSEAEARRLLSTLQLRSSERGKLALLTVQSAPGVDADLEVSAPRDSNQVVIETIGGSVDVAQFDGTVKAETGGGRIAMDQIVGEAVARTAGGDIVLGRMGSGVRCTSGGGGIRADSIGGEAFFETAGGDIVVQEVNGPIRCSTNGGGIRIAQAGNLVIVDTAGGPIDVGHAKGTVTAKNSGGPIQVGKASGVTCESAGGAIRLTSISGSLKATTAVGSIIARFQSQPVAASFLSTGAGDIILWIPSNLKVTIQARNGTYGGTERIISDFPAVTVKAVGGAAVAEGAVNGGGPLVRIAGNGGTIFIRRDEK